MRESFPDFERNVKTAQHPQSQFVNPDLEVRDAEIEDIDEKGMTGSVTELSMNDKMYKPMLPPINSVDYQRSAQGSTENQTTVNHEHRTTAGAT